MKKLLAAALCAVMILLTLTSCGGRAPEFSEIQGRLEELIEASYGVNDILFGKGLSVYPKVYENEFQPYRVGDAVYYYYTLTDEELGEICAYRATETRYFIADTENRADKAYIFEADGLYYYEIEYTPAEDAESEVGSYKNEQTGDTYYFYKLTDAELGTVYQYNQQTTKYLQKTDTENPAMIATYEADGYFYYAIDYTEPTYDFYYRKDTDPTGYSYVKLDDEYGSVELIKMYAETVYSEGYLKGVYEMLFTGAAVSDDASGVRGARYYNYEDPEGRVWLMSADDYTPLVKEKRVYDMSTAKIVRPSNKDFVNIEIESYLESTPDVRVKVTLSMIKQDGVWMLDSATY